MKTKFVNTKRKTGEEEFYTGGKSIGKSLCDYWAWAFSDLVNNVDRGKLAEFIVASALDISSEVASTWDKFDLLYKGVGIEVKSSAYLQSWYQERESNIAFAVRPTVAPIENTGTYDNERKRQSDIYIFCLLAYKDKLTLDPINLDQWIFYIIPTTLLDTTIPTQKSISLSFFTKHGIHACKFTDIRSMVDQIIGHL